MQDEQLDHMDDLIREASDSHHPVYDDKAWEKMEALLDQHLPVKKQAARPAIIIILLLFMTIGGLITLVHWPQVARRPAPVKNDLAAKPRNNRRDTGDGGLNKGAPATLMQQRTSSLPVVKLVRKPGGDKRWDPLLAGAGAVSAGAIADGIPGSVQPLNFTGNGIGAGAPSAGLPSNFNLANGAEPLASASFRQQAAVIDPKTKRRMDLLSAVPPPGPKSPGKKAGFNNNFAVRVSVAADRGFVNANQPGKSRLNYGAGASYDIGKRFTVSGGFYFIKKVYAADGDAYHPPKTYWTNRPGIYLHKVYADCIAYEIPVGVSYNFASRGNHNWLAGLGLSSLLMKKETYYYKYDTLGVSKAKTWRYKNGKDRFLSVLAISAGYQYRFGHRASMVIQPYLELPLTGFGFGKIDLKSMGVALTGTFRPFARKK
jgi:hypothetical protein